MDLVPRKPIQMNISSSPAHLPVVRAALEMMCQMMGFDEKSTGVVVLSVDEALTNIIRHAYGGDDHRPIQVDLVPEGVPEPRALRICLTDWGKKVDPSKIRSRDLNDVRPGGLGVHIITECMDQVEYRPQEECGTVLTMVKNLPLRGSQVSEKVAP